MARLTPVDYDPFAQQPAEPRLVPVEGDPFAAQARTADDPSLWAGGKVPGGDDATQGMSAGRRGAAGIWQSIRNTALGAGQFLSEGSGALGAAMPPLNKALGLPEFRNPAAEYFDGQIEQNREADAALLSTPAGFTGNLAGQIGQMAIPGFAYSRVGGALPVTGRAGVARGAVEGGAFSLIQPVQEGDSRVMNAAIGTVGGAGGQVIASKAAKLISAGREAAEPGVDYLLAAAKKAGINLGLPQISQNQSFRTIADAMGRLPFSGAGARAKQGVQEFNRAVSRTFGEDAPAINSSVFAAAKDRIGAEFDRLSAASQVRVTPGLTGQLREIQNEAARFTVGDTGRVVGNWIDDLISKAGPDGVIPGQAYKSFDSKIGKQMAGGGEVANYLGSLRDAVRSAAGESLSGADKAAWAAARRQYASLKTVEPLVAREGGTGISPQALLQRVIADKAGKGRMASGAGGDLGDLAKIGQRFMRAAPDTGTADRAVVNLSALGLLGGSQGLGWISPEQAALASAVLVGNNGLLRLLNSGAAGKLAAMSLPPGARQLADQGMRAGVRALPYAGASAALSAAPDKPPSWLVKPTR